LTSEAEAESGAEDDGDAGDEDEFEDGDEGEVRLWLGAASHVKWVASLNSRHSAQGSWASSDPSIMWL
jgi:hypothetical protein